MLEFGGRGSYKFPSDIEAYVDEMFFENALKDAHTALIKTILSEFGRRLDELNVKGKEKLLSELKNVLEIVMINRREEMALTHAEFLGCLFRLTDTVEDIRELLPKLARL